ncbi:putative protein kinase RLK-Pelle-LRR-I-1 family [Helianthus annuus]|nr:putative protein kinase RLK-Pelle-LRR-I-1 family [Helianthus annuus]KAJ0873137.1 putative protein kinase RLK-Pelle-LRR-I-1 family [Helianthus annuus]
MQGGSFDHLRIRLSEILSATNNFSDTFYIGYGGYGRVYKAELHHFDGINPLVVEGKNTGEIHKRHTTVAIKRIITRVDTQAEQGFFTEIELLSKCRHSNVVSLLGFCDERSEMILVYEYVSNGSLENFLENKDRRINFTWAERIQMCLDIANGLNYLHTSTEDKQCIIHRDIKSANILLNDKWEAKIADFGLSKLHYAREKYSTLATNNIAGTQVYLDPEYEKTGRLKTKSDIYSFGVVMFEIMCGTLAYDKTYDEKGLPSLARQCFVERTLKNLVDPNIEKVDMLFGGFDQESFDMFTNVAYKCIAIAQSERPTMEFVIRELQKALNIQKNKGLLHISLNAMNMGTQNFSDSSCLGEGRFWKLYKGEVEHANGYSAITAKRWDSHSRKGDDQFWKELAILFKHKHENIIHLIGFCYEKNEKIIVYEHASNGRLDKHFDDVNLRWMKRLEICFDVANGLKFLHTGGAEKDDKIIHGDIKSGSILLDDDWNAKICNLECSCKTMVYDRAEHIDDSAYDSLGHVDPKYKSTGYLTEKSDIYSLGVILLEMLCGKLAWEEGCEDHSQSLVPLAKKHYETNRNLNEMIFTGIKEQIEPLSLTTFVRIVFQCIEDEWDERPEASEVVIQLKEALGFQVSYHSFIELLFCLQCICTLYRQKPRTYPHIQVTIQINTSKFYI